MRIVQIGGKYKATRPDRRVDYISLPLSLLDNGTPWHQIATWFHSEKWLGRRFDCFILKKKKRRSNISFKPVLLGPPPRFTSNCSHFSGFLLKNQLVNTVFRILLSSTSIFSIFSLPFQNSQTPPGKTPLLETQGTSLRVDFIILICFK